MTPDSVARKAAKRAEQRARAAQRAAEWWHDWSQTESGPDWTGQSTTAWVEASPSALRPAPPTTPPAPPAYPPTHWERSAGAVAQPGAVAAPPAAPPAPPAYQPKARPRATSATSATGTAGAARERLHSTERSRSPVRLRSTDSPPPMRARGSSPRSRARSRWSDRAPQTAPHQPLETALPPKPIPPAQISIALISCSSETKVDNVEATYDVRLFHDPNSHHSLRMHDGRHYGIQQGIMKNHPDAFKSLVAAVLDEIRLCVDEGEDKLAFCFFCNRGRHRSVATAELLCSLLRAEGFTRTRTEHLDLGNRPCQVPRCRDCWGAPTSETKRMLQEITRSLLG